MVFRSCLSALLVSSVWLSADEGMWTFDNPPLAGMKASRGFAPDEKWLEHARLATVAFGSATGSFVSRDGLVMTNHHVGLKYIERVSGTGEQDFLKHGFVAATRAEEIKVPDLKLYT